MGEEFVAMQTTEEPTTVESCARFLVQKGTLTAWQAKQLYRGKLKSLVLGNYVLLDKLGQGGMGMVFKAEHRIMQRVVALKTLSPEITKSRQLLARFRREVQVAAKLEHPNIVTAYDAAQEGEVHYLVMQYVAGEDLASLVRSPGVVSFDIAVNYVLQAAKGLQYAHEQGVIHRDIKPSNLLVDETGTVRVLDMGLARVESVEEKSSDLTASGAVMGTIDYMSPEQAENTRQADARSDIYSLGCTLYFLLTGRPTFQAESIVQRILAHRDAEIPRLSGNVEKATPELDRIFQKLVAKSPSERYQSMAEVIDALAALNFNQPTTQSKNSPNDADFDDFLFTMNSEESVPVSSKKRTKTAVSDRTSRSGEEEGDDDFQIVVPVEKSPIRNRTIDRNSSSSPNVKIISASFGVLALIIVAVMIYNNDSGAVDVSQNSTSQPTSESNNNNSEVVENSSNSTPEPTVPDAQSALETSLLFDGVNDYAVIPNLSLNDRSPVTLEAWMTPYSNTATANPIMLMGSEWMTLYQTGPDWGMAKLDQGRSILIKANLRLQQSERTHVAGVWNGTESRLFINGEAIEAPINRYPLEPSNGGLFLGGAPADKMGRNAPDRFFNGKIHQVRITKSARYTESFTPQELLASEQETIGLYLLNEGRGDQIKDISGNSNHGTVHGAVWSSE